MSVQIVFHDEAGEELFRTDAASNLGWAQFGEWAAGLDAERFERVVQFWEWGATVDSVGLAGQIGAALNDHPPAGSVAETAGRLAELCRAHPAAAVTAESDA